MVYGVDNVDDAEIGADKGVEVRSEDAAVLQLRRRS